MNAYYQAALEEAAKAGKRFVDDEPSNVFEEILFDTIRRIGSAIGEMLQRWLDQLRGFRGPVIST